MNINFLKVGKKYHLRSVKESMVNKMTKREFVEKVWTLLADWDDGKSTPSEQKRFADFDLSSLTNEQIIQMYNSLRKDWQLIQRDPN